MNSLEHQNWPQLEAERMSAKLLLCRGTKTFLNKNANKNPSNTNYSIKPSSGFNLENF